VRSREEAAEALKLKLVVNREKRRYEKAIAIAAPWIVGGFCGIGLFAKIGWIMRAEVVGGSLWTEKAPLAIFALLTGVMIFMVGGFLAQASTRAAAREMAFGFNRAKAWAKYGLALMASLAVMALDGFMQHEGIKVLTMAVDGEKAAASEFVWVYFVFGLAIIFAYVSLKAVHGHEEGSAEGSADRADIWRRAKEAEERTNRRSDALVQDAVAAVNEALSMQRQLDDALQDLAQHSRPFQAKIDDLERLRIEEPSALTERDMQECQQSRDDYAGVCAEFEALVESVAPASLRRFVSTQRISGTRGAKRKGVRGWLARLFGR
jgi:hypothetical protein